MNDQLPDIKIKSLPSDVHKIILQEQAKQKEIRGTNQFSLSSTIFKIIREWEKCRERK